MLTREENEMLVRTGPGTPMGELFRRFWIPALLSEELPHPDCPPVRVTLLGELLIAFKDTQGRIGLLERYCPHRLADLFWGRNEECGLRCAYHSWKFDVEGHCLDIPNAPEGETFKQKVRIKAYPTVERAGIVWAYMGPTALMPELPEFEWMRVPESHRYVNKFLVEGNYAQALEGEVDSSHVSFLHSRVDSEYGAGSLAALGPRQPYMARDKAPRWVTNETEYGLMLAAQRNAEQHTFHWRINQFFMPFTVSIATPPGIAMRCNVRVPIDDEHSWQCRVRWNPDRPLTEKELAEYKHRGVDYPELIPGTYIPKENKRNDYLIDRAAQRAYSFTGIKSLPAQDMAVQADQGGVIADRTREHLVSSDVAIIALRRRLLTAATDLLEGKEPPEAHTPAAYCARAMDILLDRSMPLEEGMKEYATARWDVPQPEVIERISQ
jgi:phenylpropionate dioxygenase-like ring-hydroxylating dioxygenase large terminal subunit